MDSPNAHVAETPKAISRSGKNATKLRCGAKTRKGTPCNGIPVKGIRKDGSYGPLNGRCKMHGGRHKGPITEAGKARALLNLVQFRKVADPQQSENALQHPK